MNLFWSNTTNWSFSISETNSLHTWVRESLKQSGDCLKDSRTQECKELVSEIEKLQLVVFDQNRFKCQSSLLGIQSAIIEAYFSKDFSNERISFMIPYVIKNC